MRIEKFKKRQEGWNEKMRILREDRRARRRN